MSLWTRLRTRPRLLITAVLAITLLTGGSVFYLVAIQGAGPIPRSVRHGLSFELYYPYKLPAGYSVDTGSFRREEGDVLTFSIIAPDGRNVGVSEAALPPAPPEHKKVPSLLQIPGELVYDTPIGSAKINNWDKQYVSDILTPTTWIILNVSGFTLAEAKAVTNSFTKL